MKLASLLFALFLLASCAPGARAAEKRSLYVYTWVDYFPPSEIKAFERQYDCTVHFEYYDSNDTMLTTLSRGGGYDIVTPPPNIARTLFDEGKLQPLDLSLLPNIGNIDTRSPAMIDDPYMNYSVPYTITVTGIGYNKTMVTDKEADSWAIFADKRFHNRMTMLNDMRETIGAGLKYLGYSINSTDPHEIEEAGMVVREWKKNLDVFDVDNAMLELQNGNYAAVQAYGGDVTLVMAVNPDISFTVPREGASLSIDVFTIASDSEHPDLAHAFINHFLDATVAKNTMLEINFPMPNVAAMQALDEETRHRISLGISPEMLQKCEAIRTIGNASTLYDKVWEGILLDTLDHEKGH